MVKNQLCFTKWVSFTAFLNGLCVATIIAGVPEPIQPGPAGLATNGLVVTWQFWGDELVDHD